MKMAPRLSGAAVPACFSLSDDGNGWFALTHGVCEDRERALGLIAHAFKELPAGLSKASSPLIVTA